MEKRQFGKKNQKTVRYDKRKVSMLVLSGVVAVGITIKGVDVGLAYMENKIQSNVEAKKKAEEEIRAEEQRRLEEEERKKYTVGVKHEAKKYSYDAAKVAEKLSKYDYSNNGEKVVFLTFDDGASSTVTPEVLRILKDEGVKATFFLTGKTIENGGDKAKELVKQEFEEGHAIANHSYSHDYKHLYPGRTLNLDNFISDFEKTDKMLKEILGEYFSTRVWRCPGGFMSWRGMDSLKAHMDENGLVSMDWNALNADAEGKKKSASELVEYVKKTSKDKEIVVLLMHDTYGKDETAKALPQIIKYFKNNGYSFKTLV